MSNSYYKEVVSPAENPVSLAEAKEDLRIKSSVTAEDNLISGYITSAVITAEIYCQRQFVEREWEGYFSFLVFNRRLCSVWGDSACIEIQRSPVNEISEVAFWENGAYVALEQSDYQIKQSNSFPRILFCSGFLDPEVPYPFRVKFKSGYGVAADVPENLKTGIKEHVNFLYENRGDVQAVGKERIPVQCIALYNQFKIMANF